jgi:hypothetical protein
VILDAGDTQAKRLLERAHRFMRSNFEAGRRFANPADFQPQLDGWCDRVNRRVCTAPFAPSPLTARRGADADAVAPAAAAGL